MKKNTLLVTVIFIFTELIGAINFTVGAVLLGMVIDGTAATREMRMSIMGVDVLRMYGNIETGMYGVLFIVGSLVSMIFMAVLEIMAIRAYKAEIKESR